MSTKADRPILKNLGLSAIANRHIEFVNFAIALIFELVYVSRSNFLN